ncbi:hypothetical protein V6260_08210 [Pseudoalteromonas aliena]
MFVWNVEKRFITSADIFGRLLKGRNAPKLTMKDAVKFITGLT